MMRFSITILAFLGIQECLGQVLFTGASTHLFTESQSSIYITGEAVFQGSLSNMGILELDGNANFTDNQDIGSIKLSGSNDQLITGNNLVSDRFELDKENRAILLANQLDITENLLLNTGILSASLSKLTILSGLVSGGSEQSYVTGPLSIVSSNTENLLFPVGIENEYVPLTIHSAPRGELTAEAFIPSDPSTMIPGDSLIGVADEAAWKLTAGKNVSLNSQVSISYSGLDLQSFPVNNPIRANKYAPVVACLAKNKKYMSMEVGDGSDETIASFGHIVSKRSIQLSDSSIYLGVGVSPVSDGLKFYVPSIFTPTGAMEENRTFRAFLLGTKIERVEMNIWDKFNNKVFSEFMTDVSLEETGWNGLYDNGIDAPQGVYYYSIEVTSSGGYFEKSGTVLLVR